MAKDAWMRGIAGTLSLQADVRLDRTEVRAMLNALRHRGSNVYSWRERANSILASCGDPFETRQNSSAMLPTTAPDVVLDGLLFGISSDISEQNAKETDAARRIGSLWDAHGEQLLPKLRGQFAIALHDSRRNVTILARDRSGTCPLFWTQRQNRLWFASEIKALLAVGAARAEVDVRGIDQLFTFFAITGRRTCFREVFSVPAGCFLKIMGPTNGSPAKVELHRYWDASFPDCGDELDGDEPQMVAAFAERFEQAVRRRLSISEPVASYLSGGLDSSAVLAAARSLKGEALPTFTIGVKVKGGSLDESTRAAEFAASLQCPQTVVECRQDNVATEFPHLVAAAESPVMVTSCTALLRLAREVHRHGYQFALSGEGADEILAGHPWFKVNRFANLFDAGCVLLSNLGRAYVQKLFVPQSDVRDIWRVQQRLGGPNAYHDLYSMFSLSRLLFYGDAMWERLGSFTAYDDLDLNVARMQRWHPLNRSLYLGHHIMLPGLLLNHKGDRPAMANGVRTLYPFLDEDLMDFVASLHPRWKLSGWRNDKVLLRRYASRLLPKHFIQQPKKLFKTPLPTDFFRDQPTYVRQLLSRESLQKSGYFNADRVEHFCQSADSLWNRSIGRRLVIRQGLIGVLSTQLWHHLYVESSLCELPGIASAKAVRAA